MGKEQAVRERRRHERLSLRIPVELKLGRKIRSLAEVTDMSPAGMRLAALDHALKQGQTIWIRPVDSKDADRWEVPARVAWLSGEDGDKSAGVAFESKVDYPLFFSALIGRMDSALLASPLLQDLLDSLYHPVAIILGDKKVAAISSHFPGLAFDAQAMKGAPISSLSSFFDALDHQALDLEKAIAETLSDFNARTFQTISYTPAGSSGERSFLNISLNPVSLLGDRKALVLECRDVTSLCRLKERLAERDESLAYQSRYMILGQIFDELLDDIVNPLSAVAGRLDLLQMKVRRAASGETPSDARSWSMELDTITRLFDDVVELCRVAAKRRERDKLSSQGEETELNQVVEDALGILLVQSMFRSVRVDLKLDEGLPEVRGDAFTWTNTVVCLLQAILKRMKGLQDRHLSISTSRRDGKVALSITHNARALPLPVEKSVGPGVFDFLANRYGLSVTTAGGTGNQTITLYIEPRNSEGP